MPTIPDGVAENVGSASKPAWPACRSRILPATTPIRFTTSTSRSPACKRRARGDRQGRRRRRVHRAHRRLHPGRPDLDETIRRLKAFADAGADCLYSPGIKTREQIEAIVKAVAPKPVNFLNSGAFGFTVNDLAALGVRRISVGGTLARVAMHAFIKSAREIAEDGKFDSFAGVISNAELNKFFHDDAPHGTSRERPVRHPQTGQPLGAPVDRRRRSVPDR